MKLSMELKCGEGGIKCLLEEGLLALEVLPRGSYLVFEIAAVKGEPVP
jgi:hypothetical protein